MNFIIRSLIIFTMLTSVVYAEETTKPEKTWLQKLIALVFPAKESVVVPEIPTPEKGIQLAAEKKTKKIELKPLPEISLGSKDAPVTLINYSSLSCGHCAHFNEDILPEIEKKYIKPGYLRIIFRDYPGDQVTLKAHQLAWCKGEMKYLDLVKTLFENQEKWLSADDPVVALKALAIQNGFTPAQFEACTKNQELMDQIIALRLEGQKKYSITGTPTIVINAKIYQKELSLEEIDDIMEPLVALHKGTKN